MAIGRAQIVVNGLSLSVACEPGDEARVERLGRDLDRRVRAMRNALPGAGDAKLLIAVALSLLDEAGGDEGRASPDVQARLSELAERAEAAARSLS